MSTCDLNDWKDLGQADGNILSAAWWPLTSRGRRIYIYIADSLDEEEREFHRALYVKGRRRHFAAIPVIVASGPLLPIIALNPSSHHVLGLDIITTASLWRGATSFGFVACLVPSSP